MRPPAAPLRRWSVVWHVIVLVAAWGWAAAVIAFYYGYHFAQASSPWTIYNGRTYYTHPPAQTLASVTTSLRRSSPSRSGWPSLWARSTSSCDSYVGCPSWGSLPSSGAGC